MKTMKTVLIIEDEEASAQRLQRILLEIRPEYEVKGILNSIAKSIEWLANQNQPDLILMDIHLADGLSLEIFNLNEIKCPVIFTTAYDEYAVKAFKYNSIDYLLKPIGKVELNDAVSKFEKIEKPTIDQDSLIKNLISYIDKKEYRTRFLLPYRDGFKKLNVGEISFFHSKDRSTFAVLFNGELNLIIYSLDTLEEQLDPKLFFRVSRQYIIHLDSIEEIQNYFNSRMKLKIKQCSEEIIISRLKATLLKEWLGY